MLRLVMPYPPGTNTLYGVRAMLIRGKPMAFPYKTHEHREYVVQARLAVLEAGLTAEQLPRWPKPATVAMRIDLYRPRRSGDIDGPLKTLLDVCQGLVFDNDDQVVQLEVYRHDDKQQPRVELVVTELASEQATLFMMTGAATGGATRPGGFDGLQPPDARGTGPARTPVSSPVAAREVLPEPLQRKLRRLARPAVISNRSDDPESS